MRQFLPSFAFVFTCMLSAILSSTSLPYLDAIDDKTAFNDLLFYGPIQVQLQDPVYLQGVMSTEKGGIVTGKNLYIQAKNISYTKKPRTVQDNAVNYIEASGQLYMVQNGQVYLGNKVEVDVITGLIRIQSGWTKMGDWYVGGETITIRSDGHIDIELASLSTSENQQNDWTIKAHNVHIIRNQSLHAKNVTFFFENVPLFWIPKYSRNFTTTNKAPFKYRARWGKGKGARIGFTYNFEQYKAWSNKAILDYNFKYGIGVGLLSSYKGSTEFERFTMLNYLAQGKDHSIDLHALRYRLQGIYHNYYEKSNLNFVAMYDKLSDPGMKSEFSDHPLSDTRAGLTQATVWREEKNWIAKINTRVRINNFQTVKQELPILTFNVRPYVLGGPSSKLMIENTCSAGYLSYKYAKQTEHVTNFASTRNEIAQRIYGTYIVSPFVVTPSVGYRVVQYSSSPQHRNRVQLLAETSLHTKTRFVKASRDSFQAIEPYVNFNSVIRPTVAPGKNYIFDIEDGWDKINQITFGFWHTYSSQRPLSDGFCRKIATNIYTRSFPYTRHIAHYPTKIWLNSTFDATSCISYKLESAYDMAHNRVDHCNIAMRRTISSNKAITFEYRQRSKYAWRKLDHHNFIVDATRSQRSLLKSEMSDERKTMIAHLYWAPLVNLNIEVNLTKGFRHTSPKRYHDVECTVATIVRGALQLRISYGLRSGKEHRWYLSVGLGAKKGSRSTEFRKIGDGNYDVW